MEIQVLKCSRIRCKQTQIFKLDFKHCCSKLGNLTIKSIAFKIHDLAPLELVHGKWYHQPCEYANSCPIND